MLPLLDPSINRVTVAGYKSIATEQSIEIRPLTLLAGANSSGKSSIMQPVLLLKQTLEASYDPGALLLHGPNVRLTSLDQALSRCQRDAKAKAFLVGVSLEDGVTVTSQFSRGAAKGITVSKMTYKEGDKRLQLHEAMTTQELQPFLDLWEELDELARVFGDSVLTTVRDRCFLEVVARNEEYGTLMPAPMLLGMDRLQKTIREVIHVPGGRSNPERAYPVAYVGTEFPGTFEAYTASVLARWQGDETPDKLEALSLDLAALGLTTMVRSTPINDAQVEIQVSRLPKATKGTSSDFVR
jgi:hypothetical protein